MYLQSYALRVRVGSWKAKLEHIRYERPANTDHACRQAKVSWWRPCRVRCVRLGSQEAFSMHFHIWFGTQTAHFGTNIGCIGPRQACKAECATSGLPDSLTDESKAQRQAPVLVTRFFTALGADGALKVDYSSSTSSSSEGVALLKGFRARSLAGDGWSIKKGRPSQRVGGSCAGGTCLAL